MTPTMSMADGVTGMLNALGNGGEHALNGIFPVLYDELKIIARSQLRQERPDHTLQPTALVHEAYFRLMDQRHVTWRNRFHFFGIASRVMRRILVDHARGHEANKRFGDEVRVPIEDALDLFTPVREAHILEVDEALAKLENKDPFQARIVELRFFSGLTIEETANVLEVSGSTVKREWNFAKAWLTKEIRAARRTR